MAVYDGFFDAALDEETGEYDRAYNSGDFTTYFDKIIGSGVCIHNNPDSYKLEYEDDGKLFARMGYLFIRGFWAANVPDKDEDPATYKGYEVILPDNGTYAVVAHLNYSKKIIEIEVRTVSQAYTDSLVLGIVNGAAKSAEDTRHNTDICGVIDSAGELSTKVEWAINYIDNEIENKLAAAEASIADKSKQIDSKIAEVQAQVDKITPPAVGSIKLSASRDVGEEWLPCNGDFISEAQYPELVAALGKLTPSGDKFQLISDGEIGPQISNGVVYNGRMWVYSYSAQKLYGIDLDGSAAVKEIEVTSEDSNFKNFVTPSNTKPLALSIVPSKTGAGAIIFLAQIISSVVVDNTTNQTSSAQDKTVDASDIQLYAADFAGEETSITVKKPFSNIIVAKYTAFFTDDKTCIPYVTSTIENGSEYYYMVTSGALLRYSSSYYSCALRWRKGATKADSVQIGAIDIASGLPKGYYQPYINQRVFHSRKNNGEAIFIKFRYTGTYAYISIISFPSALYSRDVFELVGTNGLNSGIGLTVPLPGNIAGTKKVLFGYDTKSLCSISTTELEQAKGVKITDISTPSAARTFVDAGAYLWGKDIYMIFVGTGIIFSRTLEEGSFGYLDTTSVLGTITQFGYLDYSPDEGTLYLLGQDTANRVKAAKIVLNTLFDYANDGAWLPTIASDGVPAYIKAKKADGEGGNTGDLKPMTITIQEPYPMFDRFARVIFNGEELIAGTYTRSVPQNGKFTVGFRLLTGGNNSNYALTVTLNGATAVSGRVDSNPAGYEKTASFNAADYISGGITLQGTSD